MRTGLRERLRFALEMNLARRRVFHLDNRGVRPHDGDMAGQLYEFTFEVPILSQELEDQLVEELDAFPFQSHDVQFVTIETEAESCLKAALTAIRALCDRGIEPIRLVEDLVNQAEIGRRIGLSSQAVGLWVRGERRKGVEFPAPYVTGPVPLWLWRDIQDVLPLLDIELDDTLTPSRTDIQRIAGSLRGMHDSETLNHESGFDDSWQPSVAHLQGSFLVETRRRPAGTIWRHDFHLSGTFHTQKSDGSQVRTR